MKPRRKKIITYQQVVVPIPKKTILGDSSMVLGHRSASLGYNSLIFKDLRVVPKEPHPIDSCVTERSSLEVPATE
jgi:hypothetical protein